MKYILLVIPFILFGNSILDYFHFRNLSFAWQDVLNLAITESCMIFLLRKTTLHNIMDWIIGICFSVYFMILYSNTVYVRFILDHFQLSFENIRYLQHSVNLIPLKGIMDVIRYSPDSFYQIFGNLFMLTPLAFSMMYFMWTKNSMQAIWYCFLCTIGIEIIQFIQSFLQLTFNLGIGGRSTDIDDVILNTIGAAIGVIGYFIWCKVGNRTCKKMLHSRDVIYKDY
ncbi:MAG: VanZ family protein [Heyndrickxia sp.]